MSLVPARFADDARNSATIWDDDHRLAASDNRWRQPNLAELNPDSFRATRPCRRYECSRHSKIAEMRNLSTSDLVQTFEQSGMNAQCHASRVLGAQSQVRKLSGEPQDNQIVAAIFSVHSAPGSFRGHDPARFPVQQRVGGQPSDVPRRAV